MDPRSWSDSRRCLAALGFAAVMLQTLAGGTDSDAAVPAAAPAVTPAESALEAARPQSAPKWAFSAAVGAYFIPDDREYVQPTVTADRSRLHLEARYNYEGLDSGSVWVGYNLGGGGKLTWELTPMLGGVIGDVAGLAPGYRAGLAWWRLELASEGEFVIDTRDTAASFFYVWTELTLSPVDWFRFGLVVQRTRVWQAERDVQRGFLLGVAIQRVGLTACVFNPDLERPTVVGFVTLDF